MKSIRGQIVEFDDGTFGFRRRVLWVLPIYIYLDFAYWRICTELLWHGRSNAAFRDCKISNLWDITVAMGEINRIYGRSWWARQDFGRPVRLPAKEPTP